MEINLKKILAATILIFLAIVSIFLISGKASSLDTYSATIASLDEKADTVLKLTATSTLASAGVSAIPGDTATPIAEKLADFTEYFLLIMCILYAEKYLLTIIGAGVFKVIIPLACLLLIIGLFKNPKVLNRLAAKLILFGLAIFVAVPLSIRVSDAIYNTYKASIDNTISTAEEFSDETSGFAGAEGDESVLSAIWSRISETASTLSDKAANILNNFVESLAVMIVTSCIIPVLVLLFFLWLIKLMTGIELPAPVLRRRGKKPENTEE